MTLRKKLFKRFALILFGVFVINSLANFFFWYQSLPWFDDMMHFLGGVAGGIFLVWFFYKKYSVYISRKKALPIILMNSLAFLVVAGLWEVMEFSVQDLFDIGNTLADKNDSVTDLMFGLAGNLLALAYYFSKPKEKNATI